MIELERYDIHIIDEGDGYIYLDQEIKPDGKHCDAKDAMGYLHHRELDRISISKLLDRVGIENYGSTEQIHRVRMLADRDAAHVKMIQELSAKVKELEAKLQA